MRKIIPVFFVFVLVVNGFGVIAQNKSNDDVEFERFVVNFGNHVVCSDGDYDVFDLISTNSFLMESNKPLLPCYEHSFVFPIGTVIDDVYVEMDITRRIMLENMIKCVPSPVLTDMEFINGFEECDINLGSVYPDNDFTYVVGRGLDDDERCLFLKVDVYPVRYYADENMVEYSDNIEIIVEYQSEVVQNKFDDEYEFVVISSDGFAGELSGFVNHKISRGVSTRLITLSDVYNGVYFSVEGRDDPEKIKYFIKNCYDNWGTQYILLVGGDDDFPVREVHIYVDYNDGDDEIFISDLYYADLYDGDNEFASWDTNNNDVFGEYDWGENHLTDEMDIFPDVCLGRIPCINSEDLQNVISKIITYENQEAWTKDWFTKIVVIGGDTIPGYDGIDEGEYVNQAILDIMSGFTPDKIWDSNQRLSGIAPTGTVTINNAVNSGCGFLDWAGHGNVRVWTTYPHNGSHQTLPTPTGTYYNYKVMDLVNGDKLPIVVTGACSVGKFNKNDNCFTWSFVNNPDGGGIASIGPSGLSWGSSDTDTINRLEGRMQVNLFNAYAEGVERFGHMWVQGINNYIRPSMDGGHHKTGVQWQPFGDPTLQIASESQPPLKPQTPTGKSNGKAGVEYSYTTDTTDPEGNDVYYQWDWGDDDISIWFGPYQSGKECVSNHTFSSQGNFEIRVQARDSNGRISEWSDPFSVSMPKNKPYINTPFIRLLENHPRMFPLLRKLLRL